MCWIFVKWRLRPRFSFTKLPPMAYGRKICRVARNAISFYTRAANSLILWVLKIGNRDLPVAPGHDVSNFSIVARRVALPGSAIANLANSGPPGRGPDAQGPSVLLHLRLVIYTTTERLLLRPIAPFFFVSFQGTSRRLGGSKMGWQIVDRRVQEDAPRDFKLAAWLRSAAAFCPTKRSNPSFRQQTPLNVPFTTIARAMPLAPRHLTICPTVDSA
jgi:hypothetical protein